MERAEQARAAAERVRAQAFSDKANAQVHRSAARAIDQSADRQQRSAALLRNTRTTEPAD
jgi:hypothetical protein